MKILILTLTVFLSPLALATSLTVKSNDAKTALQSVPQATIGILSDLGFKFKDAGGGVFAIGVNNLHCDYRSRGAFDEAQPLAGIETTVCRYDSANAKDSTKGRMFRESRGINTVLGLLDAEGSVIFTDCAMGYCGTFAKSIACTVDTNIAEFSAGRFSCTFTDGN